MLADYHIHTKYSPDSNADMESYIKQAITLGYNEICFTDHIDYGTPFCFCTDCPRYTEDIYFFQNKYKNQIDIKLGMEFGAQARHKDYFQNIFNQYPFDFIILSFHLIDNKDLWDRSFQRGKTQAQYNQEYYKEILRTIQVYNDYSVLGHLDLIRRYDDFGEYPFKYSKEIIEQILIHIINNNKGIEINTSSFRYQLKDLMPSRSILKFYKELGGEIITIGSDAHNVAHLGYKIKGIKNYLKTIGYKYICTFDKMQPRYWEL